MLQLLSLLVFARSLHSTWFVCVCVSLLAADGKTMCWCTCKAKCSHNDPGGGRGGCSGAMANKDAFCQPPVSSEQTSAFLKHLPLAAPNKFIYDKIIYRVFFDHMWACVHLHHPLESDQQGNHLPRTAGENKRGFPFYSPNCWTNTLKAWNLFKVYSPTGARGCYQTDLW